MAKIDPSVDKINVHFAFGLCSFLLQVIDPVVCLLAKPQLWQQIPASLLAQLADAD